MGLKDNQLPILPEYHRVGTIAAWPGAYAADAVGVQGSPGYLPRLPGAARGSLFWEGLEERVSGPVLKPSWNCAQCSSSARLSQRPHIFPTGSAGATARVGVK